jgi:integrase
MRVIMGVWKSKNGVYYVRKKVPVKLVQAVPKVLGLSRPKMSWLKRSLRTKDPREANIKAKPVLVQFDGVLARAAVLLQEVPLVAELSETAINRMADYLHASMLQEDEEVRRDGTGSEEIFQTVGKQLSDVGIRSNVPNNGHPTFGLSERELFKSRETVDGVLSAAKAAVARGNISFVEEELHELLDTFRTNLDQKSPAYRRLGGAVLQRYVQALQDIERRNEGEWVVTPSIVETAPSGATLSAALEGWKKAKQTSAMTLREFEHAVQRFKELHGDLQIEQITRRHVREFREALQAIPVRRSGALRKLALPEIVDWSARHPDAKRIAPATVNKLLGGVQAVSIWGRDNGLISEDRPWADPFSNMRLEEPDPERQPWEIAELTILFTSRIYTQNHRPAAGQGEAAYWLPLLGLYTGARQGELAPLTVANVAQDELTGVHTITITDDAARSVRVKTASSRRVVPIHPMLVKLGFLTLVEERRKQDGASAALFPLMRRGPRGGFAETWSKWFGRYLRSISISDRTRVFHSFRHSFKDAVRAAGIGEDINDALTGHSGGGVGRQYGSKSMVRRFGLTQLHQAVAKVDYPGLDLSHLLRG